MNENLLNSLFELTDLIMRYSIIERFHFIQESGLSHSQMMSLSYVHCNQKVTIKDLANHLGISNPAVSQLVEKLVRSGLLIRIDNPEDRRKKILKLTDKGNTVVTQAKISHRQWIQSLAEHIQPDEMSVIINSAQIITEKQALLEASENKSSLQGKN